MSEKKQAELNGVQGTFAAALGARYQQGLTKREYFAGLAMQGLLSNTEWAKSITNDDWDEYKERLIGASKELSDELLKQLSNEH